MSPSATAALKAAPLTVSIPVSIQLTYDLTISKAQAKKLVKEYLDPDETWEDQYENALSTFVQMEVADDLAEVIVNMFDSKVKLSQLPAELTLREESLQDIEVDLEYVEVG